MTVLRIVIDRNRCTGIGICESISPDWFEVQDDGSLVVRDEAVTLESEVEVEEAVRACPAFALSLADTDE